VRAQSVLETMLSQDGRLVLVAETDGRVNGTADLIIVPNLTHNASPWGIVENLVIDEQSRRRGVGRALIDDIVTRAEEAGCYMIQLVSLKHRSGAHAFYRRHDFQPVAEGLRRYLNGYAPTGSNRRTGPITS
jgi:ribosomal protein S18 acetylase RimI-like enzyme